MEDQKQLCNESDSDNRELIKAMRFSQLDEEAAAKLYEERFRQIESDMMKKMQNKKNYQKKGLGNPRSSSSLGTYGTPSHQAILQQGQSPSATFQNNQLFSAKNQTIRSQVLSKFQATATQQGYMYQSTTLNGASRLPTEENNSQDAAQQGFVNFVPQKGKIKSQRSCEFLVTNQSPVHNRQTEENNGVLFLNQGFLSPQQAKNQGQKAKNENVQNNSAVVVLSSQINSYQKQNKPIASQTQYTQQSQISSAQSQRPFLSPPSKRTHQTNLKISSTANTSQPGISRFEMSPSGRPSTHMTSQGFYSPQASYHHHHSAHIKFNQGTQTSTNRRNQNDGEVKKFMDRKKADNNNFTSSNFVTSKYNNGSQTTTASATIVPSSEQLNSNNLLFSNITSNNGAINSPNSYLIQAQNLRSSVGFQGNNSSQVQQNNFGQYQVQAKLNGSNQTKKKDNTSVAINNKRSELEELDLRIQTIEREIERDNELTQANIKKQTAQIGPPSIFKNNQKIQNKQGQTPQAQQQSTDLLSQQMLNINQGLLAPGTATHKGSTNLYQNKQFNQNQDNQNQRYQSQNQTYEVVIESSPINLRINNASTKNQNKTQQDFNKLNIPKSDHVMNSHENSSYNNTPRSVNPIHDFRPLNKYQKKQVNFKSDNRMATSESYEEKMFKLSPTSNIFQKSLLSPSHLQEMNTNSNNANQNDLNLKSQINNQIQMQINSSSNRKNSQIHSNPPSQTRIQTPSHTVVQYSINNQKNQNNLKFQKKLNQTAQQSQYSEQSNSNVQFQNSRLGTEEGDPEMSEFEYLEKIVNAKNTEASSLNDDTSIRNEDQFQAQRVASQANVKKNSTSSQSQKQKSAIILKGGKDNSKVTPIKNQYGQRNTPFSNRESTTIQQNQQSSHFIYVESSPNTVPLNSQKQVKGQTYLSLRQSDIIPSNSSNNKNSTSKSQQKSDSNHITSFQGSSSTTQSKKLSLKTLENNFININKDNTDQQSKYSNNSNNPQNTSSVSQSLSPSPVPMYNLYSQQNQAASSTTHKSNNKNQNFEKQMQKKMNRSSEVLSKNSLNQNSNSNSNNGNQNTNITRTPSVSSNNISTISNNTSPMIQVSSSATSLNKGQLQMSNKQKNTPPVMMTHTLDTFKNKKDFKIKNPEQVSKIINQDQGQPQVRVEGQKKSNFKQAHFEDDKEEYQLEQMSKNLHKKLNLLLETANQCNENIKSYRISHNV
ncbi:hypothetical protein ABPG74_010132 [Tetrahymena malaccensis]